MTFYKAQKNSIIDEDGKQILVVLPVNCGMKLAREAAAFAAQQLNHLALKKEREKGKP